MKAIWRCVLAVLFAVAVGCGDDPDRADQADEAAARAEEQAEAAERQAEEAAEQAEAAAEEAAEQAEAAAEEATRRVPGDVESVVSGALSKARKGLTGGKEVDPVAPATLQALLPARLEDMDRGDVRGEKEGAMGFFVSSAEARYSGDGGMVEITILDLGGITNPEMMGYYWADKDLRRETDGSYERTIEYRGYRGNEKYDRGARRGQMSVLVEGRFIVSVEGDDMPMTGIKDALAEIDLERLAGLKDAGR